MGKLTFFVVAVVAGSLGAMMATNFFDETAGRPANAASGSRAVPAGSGPPIWGDTDCDGDVDGNDGLAALRSLAALEQLPQSEPCLDIGSLASDETDSTHFQMHLPREGIGHVVYCGAVHSNAHPYTLDVTASNPPALTNPDSPPKPGHDGAGWLIVTMQRSTGAPPVRSCCTGREH